jgi:ketosteroid isomerase-like protein
MYHYIVRQQMRRFYHQLSQGHYEPVLRRYGTRLRHGHTFSGDHPLGGTRHSVSLIRRWHERVAVLFPALRFDVKRIVVNGWPWNTTVAVEWEDRAAPRDGGDYVNEGVQIFRIRWGRPVGVHFYLDTMRVEEVCRRLAEQGVPEASAPPLED